MADKTPDPGPKAATLEQLEQAFPDASAEFHLSQLKAGATLEKAAVAFATACQAETAAEKKRADDAEAKAAAASVEKPKADGLGVDPLKTGGTGGDSTGDQPDPVAAWNEAVGKKLAQGMTQADAVRATAVGDPELHRAYVEEHNRRHQV